MSLSVSKIFKPVMNQYLNSLSGLLDIAQTYSRENGLEDEVLLNTRLAPDMHPLKWQFQMVSEFAARSASRLANFPLPEYPYTETSFEQLKDRIANILEFVNSIDDEKLDEGLNRIHKIPLGPDRTVEFAGPVYLNHFVLPNFYFHITTAYNILRSNGLPLGKFVFIGNMPS